MLFKAVAHPFIRVSLLVVLCGGPFSPNVMAQDMLDLKVPKYEVRDVTIEEALRVLRGWGIQICLEKAPQHGEREDVRFSINLRDSTVREILNALVSADRRYAWERYQRYPGVPTSSTNLVNVFPLKAKEDPSNLMNIRTKKAVIRGFYAPEYVIPYIHYFIPELASKLHPGGAAMSMIVGGIGGRMKLQMNFEFEDMTVREILNEIALRTGGRGWIYEAEPTPRWRVFE